MNRILLHSNIKTWFILLLFSALNKLDAQTFFDLMKRSDSLNLTISDKTSGIKKYYHKSDLVAEGKFKNGSKDSTWNFYYENGALLARGGFKDDKMVGPWLIFNRKGELASIWSYENGEADKLDRSGRLTAMGLNGRFVSYFASGNPYIKANYSHGISNGVQHTFYETGTLKHQVEFIQGFVYKQRWYYPSGKLQREHVPDIRIPKNPGRILFDRSFDEDGNLTKFEQYDYEKMLHHELRWYSSGAKRVLRVHRLGKNYGQIDSIDVAWYENGVRREETQFKYGYYHGERKSWFENGQMKSLETFYYGRKEGPEIEWEQDGTIKSKLNWCGSVGRHD